MKKQFLISVFSVLAAALLLPVGTVSASAAVLNAPTVEQTVNGITYKKYEYTDGGKQVLFYGEYKPSEESDYEFIIHNVRNDAGNITLTTVANIAADYTAKTGRKVAMATNGDYFYNTGANVDSLVMDGIVYTIGNFATKHCLGFDNEGNMAIGRMTETENFVEVTTDLGVYYYEIDKINQAPEDGEVAVYSTAQNVALNGCCKYKVRTDSTNVLQFAPTNGTFSRMAQGEVIDDKALSLNSGEFAIVVKGDNEISRFLYDNVKYGRSCRLVKKPAGAYKGMNYVIGGYSILVENGVVNTACHTDNSGNANADRTFIGVKEDGTMFLSVLDGRQAGYSVGCTVNKEAQLAKELGAKYALELDGGGSSTFLFDFNDGNGLIRVNKSSDVAQTGSPRRVSNAVLLVEKEKAEEPQLPEENNSSVNENDSENDASNVENDSNTDSSASGCNSAIAVTGCWILPAAAFAAYFGKRRK